MPLVRPVTAGVATLTFVLTWSSFLEPLVILYDRDRFTLPLALRSLSTLDPSNFPVFLAGAVIATVPRCVVFGLAQRRFLHQDLQDRKGGSMTSPTERTGARHVLLAGVTAVGSGRVR